MIWSRFSNTRITHLCLIATVLIQNVLLMIGGALGMIGCNIDIFNEELELEVIFMELVGIV